MECPSAHRVQKSRSDYDVIVNTDLFFKTIQRFSAFPHRQLFGQFADHAVQVVGQALELLIGRLEKVWTPPGQEPQGPPAVVWIPHNPAMIDSVSPRSKTHAQESEGGANTWLTRTCTRPLPCWQGRPAQWPLRRTHPVTA